MRRMHWLGSPLLLVQVYFPLCHLDKDLNWAKRGRESHSPAGFSAEVLLLLCEACKREDGSKPRRDLT